MSKINIIVNRTVFIRQTVYMPNRAKCFDLQLCQLQVLNL